MRLNKLRIITRKLGTGPHSWQPSIDDPQRCQVSKHAQVGVKDSLGGPIYKVVSSVLHCCFLLTKTAFQPTSVFYPERTAFAIQNLVLRFLLRSVENPVPNGLQHGGFVKNEQTHSVVGYIGRVGRGPLLSGRLTSSQKKWGQRKYPKKSIQDGPLLCYYPMNGQKYINKFPQKGWNISPLFRWRIS